MAISPLEIPAVEVLVDPSTSYHDEAQRRGVLDLSARHASAEWQPTYGQYDRGWVLDKISEIYAAGWSDYRDNSEFHEAASATYDFVNKSFDVFEGKTEVEDPGSFGFVVPMRLDREHWDYADEIIPLAPLLKYVDVGSRQLAMTGMCPFVVDRYGKGPDGRRGYMICAPVFSDMGSDISGLSESIGKARQIVNDTAHFAKSRMDISVVGLGAILPKLTDMGKTIDVQGLHTTTGHGGTVYLIGETLKQAEREGRITNGLGTVGIIGAGSIGRSTAELLLAEDPNRVLTISDNKGGRLSKVVAELQEKYPAAKIMGTLDNGKLLEKNKVVVSAITSRISLDEGSMAEVDLTGKFITDDSQPGCFDAEELEQRGATLAWPIGQDGTVGGMVTREWFDYQHTGPAGLGDVWGCEAEGASIAITRDYESSIDTEVVPQQAMRIGELCTEVGIGVGRLQRMGHYI